MFMEITTIDGKLRYFTSRQVMVISEKPLKIRKMHRILPNKIEQYHGRT